MLSPQDVLNWEYEDLENFLNDPVSSIENDQYDFKSTYKIRAEKLRKCFSAFANSKGGFVFLGIDNNRNICGLEKDTEITTELNRALNNTKLHPPIKKWALLKSITVPRKKPKKYVYIYYIHPSLFIDKPHMADEKIYIRQNGESKPLSSGVDIRRNFFLSKFCPEHIDQFEYQISKIKNYKQISKEIDVIDVLYFRYMEQHLEELKQRKMERNKEIGDVENLLFQYKNIRSLIDKINREESREHSSTGVPSLNSSANLDKEYTRLSSLADSFVKNYRKVHRL